MLQLINFIPDTAAKCRSLLAKLVENNNGLTLSDRYGRKENLTAEEVKKLVGLIENQIGEKAPEKAPEEKPEDSPKENAKPAKKSNSKSAKK